MGQIEFELIFNEFWVSKDRRTRCRARLFEYGCNRNKKTTHNTP